MMIHALSSENQELKAKVTSLKERNEELSSTTWSLHHTLKRRITNYTRWSRFQKLSEILLFKRVRVGGDKCGGHFNKFNTFVKTSTSISCVGKSKQVRS